MPRCGKNGTSEPSDAEVRTILVSAMADVGADPALIYAFQKQACMSAKRTSTGCREASWQHGTAPVTNITELWLVRDSKR